jgi:hypothetical protein
MRKTSPLIPLLGKERETWRGKIKMPSFKVDGTFIEYYESG